MKNVKILLIAAVIGLASVGCAEDGGKTPTLPTVPAEETPKFSLLNAEEVSAKSSELANSALSLADDAGDAELNTAAEKVSDAADAIANAIDAGAESNLVTAAVNLFIDSVNEFILISNKVIAEDSELSSAAKLFSTTAGNFVEGAADFSSDEEPEVVVPEPVVEEPEVVVPEPVVEEPEVVVPEPVVLLTEILNSDETCPEDTETTLYTCTVREDVLLALTTADEVCPEDTDTEHFTCTAYDRYSFVRGQTPNFVHIIRNDTYHTFRYYDYSNMGKITWEIKYTETVDGVEVYEIHEGDTSIPDFYPNYVPTLVASGVTVSKYDDRLELTLVNGETILVNIGSFYSGWLTQ